MIMTPLLLEIIIHYHYRADDYRDGDFSAPAVRDGIDRLKAQGMIDVGDEARGTCYQSTEKSAAYLQHILSLPLPIQKWEMP